MISVGPNRTSRHYMLGTIVDEKGFFGQETLLGNYGFEAFGFGLAYLKQLLEIGFFERYLEDVETVLCTKVGGEAVVVYLIGIAIEKYIVLQP